MAEIGELTSIPLPDRLNIERLETLWHLTAKIGVRLSPGVGLLRIFEAIFPPVSVTGVPKPEAMTLITATEDTPRGAYCGAIGFLAPPGSEGPDASFSVATRTVVIDQEEGVAEYGVGTAITNSSDVISAYEEARLKARILVERRPDFRLTADFRIEDGVVRAMETKVATLQDSARYFGFKLDRAALVASLRDLARDPEATRVTVLADRNGVVEFVSGSLPEWAETPDGAPSVTGVVVAQPVSVDNVFLFHRTTDSRLRDALERQYPGDDVFVLVNDHDEVATTLDGNVAVHLDGVWLTPPRGCGASPSALRTRLVDSGALTVRVVTKDQFERAAQVATIDDLHGWRIVDITA